MISRTFSGPLPLSRARRTATPLETVLGWLAIASLTELLILRTFTRTAIHIPALEQLAGPYEIVAAFGRYAYYLAAVLLILALPLSFVTLWRRGDVSSRLGAAAVALFALAAFAARAALLDVLVLDALMVAVVVLAAAAATSRDSGRAALSIIPFAIAFALSGTYTLLQDSVSYGFAAPDGRLLLRGAEVAALTFALLTPFALHAKPGRRSQIASLVIGGLLLAMLLGNDSTVKVLLLWNEGLQGLMPSFAYAAAAATLSAAVLGLLAKRRPVAAAGLLLLVLGGFGLHSTYQTGLVVVGFSALCLASSRPKLTVPSSIATAPRKAADLGEH